MHAQGEDAKAGNGGSPTGNEAAARSLQARRSQPLYSAVLRQPPFPKAAPPSTVASAAAAHAPSNLSRSRSCSGSGGGSPPDAAAPHAHPSLAAVQGATPGAPHSSYASVAGSRTRSLTEDVESLAPASQQQQRAAQEGEGTPAEVGAAEYARLPLRLSRQVSLEQLNEALGFVRATIVPRLASGAPAEQCGAALALHCHKARLSRRRQACTSCLIPCMPAESSGRSPACLTADKCVQQR